MTGIARAKAAGVIGICLLVASVAVPSRGAADEGPVARLTRALAAEEAQDGGTSPYLLPIIEELAQAQRRDGALGEAAALRRRALDIAVAAFGCDSASAAAAMAALAFIDIDRRRYLDAEPLLIAAERVLTARVAADHPAMATVFAGLARVALARGEIQPAEAWASHALAMAKRNPHGRSAEALRTLSLAQLGKLYLRQGKPGEALPLIEEAAAIDQGRLGPTHPFIADDLHDLGLAYDALARGDEAHRALIAALSILERGAGRETPRVAYVEIELSRLYRQAGKDAAAEAAFRDARRILNKAEAEEHRRERNV